MIVFHPLTYNTGRNHISSSENDTERCDRPLVADCGIGHKSLPLYASDGLRPTKNWKCTQVILGILTALM